MPINYQPFQEVWNLRDLDEFINRLLTDTVSSNDPRLEAEFKNCKVWLSYDLPHLNLTNERQKNGVDWFLTYQRDNNNGLNSDISYCNDQSISHVYNLYLTIYKDVPNCMTRLTRITDKIKSALCFNGGNNIYSSDINTQTDINYPSEAKIYKTILSQNVFVNQSLFETPETINDTNFYTSLIQIQFNIWREPYL